MYATTFYQKLLSSYFQILLRTIAQKILTFYFFKKNECLQKNKKIRQKEVTATTPSMQSNFNSNIKCMCRSAKRNYFWKELVKKNSFCLQPGNTHTRCNLQGFFAPMHVLSSNGTFYMTASSIGLFPTYLDQPPADS